MSRNHTTSPVQHPYVRISHPDQRKGGGLERQTAANLEEFGRRHGFSTSKRVYIDDGVSAWQGLNATPNHELGKFLADVRSGLVRPGDCLLIENYDRLSRQDPWAAIGLVSELRSLRIHVGRLDRMKLLRYDSKDYGDFFEAAVEFMRGNSESEAKSLRNGAAWKRKRRAARDKGLTITSRLPAWIEERKGQRELLGDRAAIIQRIFGLAANGYGHALIVKKLTDTGTPSFGASGRWTRSYIAKLLMDRRCLGEFQPRFRSGLPDGEAIQDYFPAVVTQDAWYAARAGASQRKNHHGRQGRHINVFAGLIHNALDGDSYYCATRTDSGQHARVLINNAAAEGRSQCRSFPFGTFEMAIMRMLREIDPHDILNGETQDESLHLSAELARVDAELGEAVAFMNANGFSAAIGKRVADLESHKAGLASRLSEARQKARHPLSETWGETQSLLAAMKSSDDLLRLQSALRRIIDSIFLLVVPRGRDRLAAVQIWFAGGQKQRSYLILHRPAKANKSSRSDGGYICRSLAAGKDEFGFDLRDASCVEELLAALSGGALDFGKDAAVAPFAPRDEGGEPSANTRRGIRRRTHDE